MHEIVIKLRKNVNKSKELNFKFSNLYERVNYLTPLDSIINTIYEYDMRDAGFSVIKKYKLLGKKTIETLDKMPKKDRNKAIGKLQIHNEKLKKKLPKCIMRERRNLFQYNGIQDHEVVSIKNDAIFIVGRRLKNTVFNGVEFKIKNTYNMYLKVEKLECYYNKREENLDVKGLKDHIVEEHDSGILNFIKDVMYYLILGRNEQLKKYLCQFAVDYKSRKFPLIYYKECNYQNAYRIAVDIDSDFMLMFPGIEPEIVDDLNIAFNYKYFILPIINRYLKL